MLPEFDKNAAYIWVITGLGVALPLLLAAYVSLRASLAKRRLDALEKEAKGE